MDVKAGEEAVISEVELKVYKPIEIWKCKSIEDAIEKCRENEGREAWVYLEISTDRYIKEDEIKEMKSLKKDILEIMPKFKNDDEEINVVNINEKPFKEIFKEFYKKERDVEPTDEVIDMLLSIVGEEDEEE